MKTNFPKLFEGALAAAFVQTAELASLPRIRTWQAIDADGRWSPNADRVFPAVDIRAAPPRPDDNAHAQMVSVAITIGTEAADDPTHAMMASIYEAVQAVVDSLYSDFLMQRESGPERAAFDAYLADQGQSGHVIPAVSGFTLGEPVAPYLDGGVNVIGLELVVHYSRSDL
jgi:hypothetical protein